MARRRGDGARSQESPVRSRSRLPGAGARASLGIDLGGTKVALGLVGSDGRLLESDRRPTRAERPPREVIREIVDAVDSRWGHRLPRSRPLGVGVAGQVDARGTVLFGPNLDWHHVPLGSLLRRGVRRRVAVLNDVQAATFGEWKFGAGRGSDDLVCVFVGTGIGGGIVSGGRLRLGATGTAGELGHLTVERDGRPCRCPNSGCLEAYSGGWAIAERAQAVVAREPDRGRALVRLAGTAGAISAETVDRAYRAGDPLAHELVEEMLSYLACGLVSIVNALNPRTIVLGGGVLAGFASRIEGLDREVRARVLPSAARGLRIVPARLGAESGVIGAAAFANEVFSV